MSSLASKSAQTSLTVTVFPHAKTNVGEAQALTWVDFCEAMRDALAKRAPQKTSLAAVGPYALRPGTLRSARNVEYVSLAALDIDQGLPDVEVLLATLREHGLCALVHTSPSDPAPDSRKVRVYVLPSRAITPDECAPVRRALARLLGVRVDPATLDTSRVFFAGGLEGTPDREHWTLEGAPLDVDRLLTAWAEHDADEHERSGVHTTAVNTGPRVDPSAGVLAVLGDANAHQGRRWLLCGALGGVWRVQGWEPESAEATIREWLATVPGCDVDNGVRRALGAWKVPLSKAYDGGVSGRQALMDLVGVEWAERIAEASAAGLWWYRPANANANASAEAFAPVNVSAANANASAPSDTFAAVDRTIARLASANVYQRSGRLVRVTREAVTERGITRPAGAQTIRGMPHVRLGEMIAVMIEPEIREAAEAIEDEAAREKALDNVRKDSLRAGNWQAQVILERGEWSHVRPLDAIVTYPVMRPDGSILTVNGYDETTRTIANMTTGADMPAVPTLADARAALALLDDLVSDFPFTSPAHRAAWTAMLLTIVARPAIDGPTPLGLIDANAPGAGKGYLVDLASIIATGDRATVRTAPKTREEWDKTLLTLLSAGDPIVVFDNIQGTLASDALEAVLTTGRYGQRVLGLSENRDVDVRAVFFATCNNAVLSADLVRRSVHCRLEVGESPELRTDFKHEDLRAYARERRPALLGAALTIARAYALAGRPRVESRPVGSFEAWARVVRDALVWAGGADPATTQEGLRASADVETDELAATVAAWHDLLGDRALTARDVIDVVNGGVLDASEDKSGHPFATAASDPKRIALKDALEGLLPQGALLKPHTLGNRLRRARGKVVRGYALQESPVRNVKGWRVSKL